MKFDLTRHPEDKAKEFLEKIKSEEDMNADQIKIILRAKSSADGKLSICERNAVAYNVSPFDFVEGDETTLNMIGCEIKSDKDTFDRLPKQLLNYTRTFQHVYLVLHKKEAPAWLPSEVGIIRVSTDGRIMEQIYASNVGLDELYEISSTFEWQTLMEANGFATKKMDRIKKVQSSMIELRRNLLFNRFFAKFDNEGSEHHFYPMSKKLKEAVLGFNAAAEFKKINADLDSAQERLDILKKMIRTGQESDAPIPG